MNRFLFYLLTLLKGFLNVQLLIKNSFFLILRRMKKTFVFIFAFFYLGISCGFALDIHFCMGKFSSMEFYHSKKAKCGKCGMNTKNSCCNDKVTVVKLTDNQQISSNTLQLTSSFALPVYSYDS